MTTADTPGRPLLVTSALPYANGPIHFGHVAGAYLPADIFVRYQRLLGTDVLYVCGTDEHGVSITARAESEGTPYRAYVDRWHAEIRRVFDLFGISFDYFGRTSNVDPHYGLSQEFFLRLLREGVIASRTAEQHYCTTCGRFLPDRYVEGTCYLCGKPSARGDECKACGAWLEAVRILEPRCVTCGNTPEIRETTQYELDLSVISSDALAARHPRFAAWLEPGDRDRFTKRNVHATVFDKMIRGEGLRARPITRDLAWGVPVPENDLDGRPIEHEGKVLYVWFDAPIGYVSATIEWARGVAGDPDAWRRFWIETRDHHPRLVHFIGKDNIPFHCIVFPAMLAWQGEAQAGDSFLGAGPGERWVFPEDVPANEFYNLEGHKFSTSDNRMLDSERMFELFGVDVLRWYLTVSMPETADSQFRFEGLQSRANADLADTIGNYASRVLKFVRTHLDGRVPEPDPALVDRIHEQTGDLLADLFVDAESRTSKRERLGGRLERYEFRDAADALLNLARFGNARFDAHAPWKSRKDDMASCRTSLWSHLQLLSALSVAMWPFMPGASDRLREMLGLPTLTSLVAQAGRRRLWTFEELPIGHVLGEPDILFAKIPDELVEQERSRLEAPA